MNSGENEHVLCEQVNEGLQRRLAHAEEQHAAAHKRVEALERDLAEAVALLREVVPSGSTSSWGQRRDQLLARREQKEATQ